jgi:glycerol-3-phosphate dehydrogenase
MRKPLRDFDGGQYDVIAIGGGISGASSAQHLAAAGYRVLLVDKDDFASAATSRSGRLLHCGLRYLAPTYSLLDFIRNPKQFATALGAAHRSIQSSAEFLATTPEHAREMRLIFAITKDMPYKGWHVRLGARLLEALCLGRQKLDCRTYTAAEAEAQLPFIKWLSARDHIASVVTFRDHQFYWPERICLDAALDCERLGGVIRNYTKATGLERQADGSWQVDLQDMLTPQETARVTAPVILNMAGPWIDNVNGAVRGKRETARKVVAIKGVHILVKLPPECRGHGIMGTNRHKEAITCMPWGDLHYVGPTETVYDGDLDDVRPLEEDITFLLDEINHLMPGIALKRQDVLQSWAGIRPISYDPTLPKGRRMPFSVFQDLGADGLQNILTVTWAAIMFHRSAARQVVAAVKSRLKPSRAEQTPSYAARRFPENQNSPPVVLHNPDVKLADLRHSAAHEHPAGLVDLLYRRTSLGWTGSIPAEAVEMAARAVAGPLGWNKERQEKEIAAFHAYVEAYHQPDARRDWSGG